MTLETIGIVGMGAMGRGIAEVAAAAGFDVILAKMMPGDCDAAKKSIAGSLDRQVQKQKLTAEARDLTLSRITTTTSLDALGPCALVIESIVEELDAKKHLYKQLEARIGQTAVLASNTSSLPLGALAEELHVPQRFVGLHFFSPVPMMKLVEVAGTQRTYPHAVEVAQRFVERVGKTPVMVADTSGYIVNRLLVPYLLDAIGALEARVASAHAIDTAMKLGCGHPMGPLALADAIGLDIVYAMAKTMHKELNDRRYSPPATLRRLVLNGHLGKKTKLGIYDYSVETPRENPELWVDLGEGGAALPRRAKPVEPPTLPRPDSRPTAPSAPRAEQMPADGDQASGASVGAESRREAGGGSTGGARRGGGTPQLSSESTCARQGGSRS